MSLINPNAYRFAILFALLITVFLGGAIVHDYARVLGDPDSFWHIKLGTDILNSGHLPTVDTYSYTYAGKPFVSKEWLSEILLAAGFKFGGWNGVMVLTALATIAAVLVAFREFAAYLHPTVAGLFAILISTMLNPVILARPHIFTLVIAVYFTSKLFRAAEAKTAPSFWLLGLVALWSNLHGSFTLSFVIAGFAFLYLLETNRLADKTLLMKWIAFGLLCPIAAMVHPYSYQPIWIGMNMMATNKAMAYIAEWMPFDAKQDFFIEYFLLASLVGLIGARLKLGWAKTLFIVFMLHMLLTHARFVYVFFLLTPVLIIPELAERFPLVSLKKWFELPRDSLERFATKWLSPAAGLVSAGAVVAAYLFFSTSHTSPPEDVAAEKPIAFALANKLDGRVFNEYRYGGTLISHGIKTFIDGRAEQLFLGEFFPDYINSGKHDGAKLFKDIVERNQITWTLLPPDDLRNNYAEQLGWKKVYSDDKSVIYTKP